MPGYNPNIDPAFAAKTFEDRTREFDEEQAAQKRLVRARTGGAAPIPTAPYARKSPGFGSMHDDPAIKGAYERSQALQTYDRSQKATPSITNAIRRDDELNAIERKYNQNPEQWVMNQAETATGDTGQFMRDRRRDIEPVGALKERLGFKWGAGVELGPNGRPLNDSTLTATLGERVQARESTGGGGYSQTDVDKIPWGQLPESYRRDLMEEAGAKQALANADRSMKDPLWEERERAKIKTEAENESALAREVRIQQRIESAEADLRKMQPAIIQETQQEISADPAFARMTPEQKNVELTKAVRAKMEFQRALMMDRMGLEYGRVTYNPGTSKILSGGGNQYGTGL